MSFVALGGEFELTAEDFNQLYLNCIRGRLEPKLEMVGKTRSDDLVQQRVLVREVLVEGADRGARDQPREGDDRDDEDDEGRGAHHGVGDAAPGAERALQLGAQLVVVLDDAVVHQRDPPGRARGRARAVREVRVRVVHRRRAVRGPAGVGDAGAALETALAHLGVEIGHTRHAARALGLSATHGTIEPGKRADVVVLAPGRPELWGAPEADPHDLVAFGASRAAVRHVVVDGHLLVEEGRLTRLDLEEILRESGRCLAALLRRAGLRL